MAIIESRKNAVVELASIAYAVKLMTETASSAEKTTKYTTATHHRWNSVLFATAIHSSPFTTARHELTHMLIDEITGDAQVPAWLNEGSAQLEEFTMPGAQWLRALAQYRAVSMAANGRQLTTEALDHAGY